MILPTRFRATHKLGSAPVQPVFAHALGKFGFGLGGAIGLAVLGFDSVEVDLGRSWFDSGEPGGGRQFGAAGVGNEHPGFLGR